MSEKKSKTKESAVAKPGKAEAKSTGVEYTCRLCGVRQNEALKDQHYCEHCHEHMLQTYQWLQSPMLTASEYKSLQKKILNLTEIENLKLD